MLEKKGIALEKDLLGVLSPEEEKAFIFGCVFYDEYTNEGETPISKEKAASLSDEVIDLIIFSVFHSNLDLEKDMVAFNSLQALAGEMNKRNPMEKEKIEKSLRQFKEKNKEFFPDA